MRLLAIGKHCLRTGNYRRFYDTAEAPKKGFVKALNKNMVIVAKHAEIARNPVQPVVALESTIYTHGWTYPENVELAFHLEDLVRSHGATPATIGIINGVATIGLSDREIVTLCAAAGKPDTMKVSRRDLPFILGMGIAGRPIHGGTTVSSTMLLAHWAGINVFGTGGLGGVHLGGQNSLDISADLTELGRTPIGVISSGCKSFLDTARTLEFLETQGAMVATYADGRDDNVEFPGFYSRNSGEKSPMVFQSPKEAAAILSQLGAQGNRHPRPGVLFANPIPEEFSLSKTNIDQAINQAVKEAADKGIHGHQNTPYILARIKELTEGRSVSANRALIESNVVMATKIATELASLWKKHISLHGLNDRLDNKESYPSTEPTKKTSAQLDKLQKSQENSNHDQAKKFTLTKYTKTRTNHFGESKVCASRANDILKLKARFNSPLNKSPDIIIFGAVAIDLTCNFVLCSKANLNLSLKPVMNTSNVSRIEHSVGGVGHNVTLAAHLVRGNQNVRLCSLVANDLHGQMVIDRLKSETLDIDGIKILPHVIERSGIPITNRTAQYVAVNDGKKDLILGMADMQIFRQNSYYPYPMTMMENLKCAVIDANWDRKKVRGLMTMLRTNYPSIKIIFEPVSEQKGADIFRTSEISAENTGENTRENIGDNAGENISEISYALNVFPNHKIDLATPNSGELHEMFCAAESHGYFENKEHWHVLEAFGMNVTQYRDRYREIAGEELTEKGIPFQTIQLLPYIPTILTKLGPSGVLLTELLKANDPRLEDPGHQQWIISRTRTGSMYIGGVYMRLFPVPEKVDPADVVSTNGVGDTFLGVLVAGISRGLNIDDKLMNIAQRGAIMTLKSKESVSPSLGELSVSLDKIVLKSDNLKASSPTGLKNSSKEFQKELSINESGDILQGTVRYLTALDQRASESTSHNTGQTDFPLPSTYGLPPV